VSSDRLQWLYEQAEAGKLDSAQQVAVMAMLLARDARGLQSITKIELGALLNLGERQVSSILKDLEANVEAFVQKRRNGGAGKGRAANTYVLRPDATGNPVPETWFQQQSSSGNPVPAKSSNQNAVSGSENHNQQSNTGTAVPSAEAETIAHIENASAGAEDNLLTLVEIYPDRAELAATAAREPIKLNGSARGLPAYKLAEIIVDEVNSPWLNPNREQGLGRSVGRIHVWMDARADFDADILPTIREVCHRPGRDEPIRTWGYFTAAIRKATADRLAAEQPMEIITPQEANAHDQSSRARRVGADRPDNIATKILMRSIAGDSSHPK